MDFIFGVLIAAKESGNSNTNPVGLIWFAGTLWGIWHLHKKQKRQGYIEWLAAAILSFIFWWFFLLKVVNKSYWRRRRNRKSSKHGEFFDPPGFDAPKYTPEEYIPEYRRIPPSSKVNRPKIPAKVEYEVYRINKGACRACGKTAKDGVKIHIDHITALSKGGSNDIENLQLLCDRHNIGKGNWDDTDWR